METTEEFKPTVKALKQFFSIPGVNPEMVYEPLAAKEILDFKREDPEGYEELIMLAANALNES